MRTILFFMSALFLLPPYHIHAEPTSAIKYLMNEPVSMLDYGIYRLEKYLKSAAQVAHVHVGLRTDSLGLTPPSVMVDYVFSANRIIAKFHYVLDDCSPELKNSIEKVVKNIKLLSLSIFFKKGKAESRHRLADFFSHAGYTHPNVPSNLAHELEMITELQYEIYCSRSSRFVRCKSPLLSEDVYWSADKPRPKPESNEQIQRRINKSIQEHLNRETKDKIPARK